MRLIGIYQNTVETAVAYSCCRDTHQRRPANAPTRKTATIATPPRIHNGAVDDLVSATSVADEPSVAKAAPSPVTIVLGETVAVAAAAMDLDGDADATGWDVVAPGDAT